MDPLYSSTPTLSGLFDVPSGDATLYYELRKPSGGDSASPKRVIIVCGAFATLNHFAQHADALAAEGCEVLTYNHRGIHPSKCKESWLGHSTPLLAADALSLIDYVWGVGVRVHIVGVSMGGMVAQHLALSLLDGKRSPTTARLEYTAVSDVALAVSPEEGHGRIASLFIAVSTWRYSFWSLIIRPPAILVRAFVTLPNTSTLVDRVMDKSYQESTVVVPHRGPTLVGDLWREKYKHEASRWTGWVDPVACCRQVAAVLAHHVPKRRLAEFRNRGVRVGQWIAGRDDVIATKLQWELSEALGSTTVVADDAGHNMTNPGLLKRFIRAIRDHLFNDLRPDA